MRSLKNDLDKEDTHDDHNRDMHIFHTGVRMVLRSRSESGHEEQMKCFDDVHVRMTSDHVCLQYPKQADNTCSHQIEIRTSAQKTIVLLRGILTCMFGCLQSVIV